jgi:probable rRNA maturation factor
MVEVELFGTELLHGSPESAEIRRLVDIAAEAVGIGDGHLAIEFVEPGRMATVNQEHRGEPEPTDVLSFPIDGPRALAQPARRADDAASAAPPPPPAPRELGDVLVCPECAGDVREAVVHGVLHLFGMDHDTDDGEMLALQVQLLGGGAG